MSDKPLRYLLQIDEALLTVRVLRGREALGAPWRFEARLPLERGWLPEPEGLVRKKAALLLTREEAPIRRIEGLLSDVDVVLTATGGPELRVVIEAPLALLRYRRDMRIFRDKTAVDIVEEVIGGFGIPVERRLADGYASRPYCVQLRETDLDFCHRLLEDEGIAYLVADGGAVVLCDRAEGYERIGALPFTPPSGTVQQNDALLAVAERGELSAGKVSLRDFNPAHPSLPMDVAAPVPGAIAAAPELYDFPGEYLDPAEGAKKAQKLAEALRAHATGIRGTTSFGRLGHGTRVLLSGAALAADDYLVTAVEHDFDLGASGFVSRFEALPAAIPWRPARVTEVPELPNPMSGFVTGPAGADVYTDEVGRVKVHLPWDRRQPADDRCSDWVPVLQDNTGNSVAVPRVGWEVLVHFLEGDPDRPVVLGRLYNGADPFPEALPEGKTRSALRSLTSPGRGGLNMIRFEDRAGGEHVMMHAEKDQTIAIANDRRQDVGVNEQAVVVNDESIAIGADHTEVVGKDRALAVAANQSLTVGGDRALKVGAARSNQVGKNHSMTIGAAHMRRIGADDMVNAKNLSETVGALILEASIGASSVNAGMAGSLTVGGALLELARKTKGESAKLGRVETVGGLLFSKSAKATTASSKARVTSVGGAMIVKAGAAVTFDAGTKMQAKAAIAAFKHAKKITLKVGGNSVVIEPGKVAITASGKIALLVSGDTLQQAGESTQI